MIEPFGFHLPIRIAFGEDAVRGLPGVLEELRAVRALAVVEAPVAAIAAVADALGECQMVHEKPVGEPTYELISALAETILARAPDALVAIGGGATIDLAKAARVEAGKRRPFADVVSGVAQVTSPALPMVAIPTTSGTGSESTGAAVVSQGGRKLGMSSPLLRVQHALVDPLLTLGLPADPTLHTGVDALAQAIGATVATTASPGSVALGIEACRHLGAGLRRVVADGSDREARAEVSLGSLLGGLAINLADCAADHALAHAVGGLTHLPHGLTVGLVLTETMEVNRPARPEVYERVADALGEPGGGSGDGMRAVLAVRRLLADLAFPTCSEVGVGHAQLEALMPAALDDYCLTTNPHRWSEADVRGAYAAAFALTAR